MVVVAEEALYGSNVGVLTDLGSSPAPMVRSAIYSVDAPKPRLKFPAFRRNLVSGLRNVAFLERPLQGMTLQATVLAAERARKRQYQAREYVEGQRELPSS